MTNPKNDKNIYKVFNNVQYRLLDNKENFSHVVNMALGKEATTPSTLHSCDSREIALISKATEKAIEENEENEVVRESLSRLSKELWVRIGGLQQYQDFSVLWLIKFDFFQYKGVSLCLCNCRCDSYGKLFLVYR